MRVVGYDAVMFLLRGSCSVIEWEMVFMWLCGCVDVYRCRYCRFASRGNAGVGMCWNGVFDAAWRRIVAEVEDGERRFASERKSGVAAAGEKRKK